MGKLEAANFPDPADRMPVILIVEDELFIRMALSDFLQECGFKVLEASSARMAIQIIETRKGEIDLVFSDVQLLDDMDGFTLAKWIRENRPGLPVILCSADRDKAKTAQEICAGEPFFTKPYDLNLVLAKIRQSISKSSTGG